ncbi:MAG: stage 0 sporulation protein, partial [Oscillospiraceae bacterium]|nr:stage 0 sporulation protein [Oscillospiraceae bacterium]
ISGTCGRLMCCLKYEQDGYEELIRTMPRVGSAVKTPDGNGVVVDLNLMTGMLTVKMDDAPDGAPKVFHKSVTKRLRAEKEEQKTEDEE